MKFIIERTSDEAPPILDAILENIPYLHVRTFTEEEFNKKCSYREGLWRSKGFDHGVTKEGDIFRKENRKENVYTIEINSLNELILLSRKYGEIILRSPPISNYPPTLEIYDTYRE
jgi:hypothetical protein